EFGPGCRKEGAGPSDEASAAIKKGGLRGPRCCESPTESRNLVHPQELSMPLTVKLPSTLNAKTMYGLIAAAVDDNQQPRDKEIHFDFSGLRFGQPSGMTVISNLIEWLGKRGVKGEFVGLDKDQRAIQYMDDCEFFNEYTGSALRDGAEVRDTTIPFRKIVCEQSHQWLDQTVCPFPLP